LNREEEARSVQEKELEILSDLGESGILSGNISTFQQPFYAVQVRRRNFVDAVS